MTDRQVSIANDLADNMTAKHELKQMTGTMKSLSKNTVQQSVSSVRHVQRIGKYWKPVFQMFPYFSNVQKFVTLLIIRIIILKI